MENPDSGNLPSSDEGLREFNLRRKRIDFLVRSWSNTDACFEVDGGLEEIDKARQDYRNSLSNADDGILRLRVTERIEEFVGRIRNPAVTPAPAGEEETEENHWIAKETYSLVESMLLTDPEDFSDGDLLEIISGRILEDLSQSGVHEFMDYAIRFINAHTIDLYQDRFSLLVSENENLRRDLILRMLDITEINADSTIRSHWRLNYLFSFFSHIEKNRWSKPEGYFSRIKTILNQEIVNLYDEEYSHLLFIFTNGLAELASNVVIGCLQDGDLPKAAGLMEEMNDALPEDVNRMQTIAFSRYYNNLSYQLMRLATAGDLTIGADDIYDRIISKMNTEFFTPFTISSLLQSPDDLVPRREKFKLGDMLFNKIMAPDSRNGYINFRNSELDLHGLLTSHYVPNEIKSRLFVQIRAALEQPNLPSMDKKVLNSLLELEKRGQEN